MRSTLYFTVEGDNPVFITPGQDAVFKIDLPEGGICIQTVLGLLQKEKLETEIRRVFSLLKGKRWICCTTHYVQNHCSIEDLAFAYDLIRKLARE